MIVRPEATGFIISFLSVETGNPEHQARFLATADDVAEALSTDGEPQYDVIDLDRDDVARLSRFFSLSLPTIFTAATLRAEHWLDRAPYLVHTGYELALMLEARKPFACFYSAEKQHLDEIRGLFHPFVVEERICEHLYARQMDRKTTNGQIKTVTSFDLYYTLPGEDWRISALEALYERVDGKPWSETDYRDEGALLGYTPQDCDWFVKNLAVFKRRLKQGDISA